MANFLDPLLVTKQMSIVIAGLGAAVFQSPKIWNFKVFWSHPNRKVTFIEVLMEGTYDFVHDINCPLKKMETRSTFKTRVIKNFWQMIRRWVTFKESLGEGLLPGGRVRVTNLCRISSYLHVMKEIQLTVVWYQEAWKKSQGKELCICTVAMKLAWVSIPVLPNIV